MAFPRAWDFKARVEAEQRMLVVDGNAAHYQRQGSLMEIYASVGYAPGQKSFAWDLPSHGKAYFDCGSIKAKGCDNHKDHQDSMDFVRYYKRSCRRKECPTCFEDWAAAQAERCVIRFATFKSGFIPTDRLVSHLKHETQKEPRAIFHMRLMEVLEAQISAGRLKPIHVVFSPGPDEYPLVERKSMTSYLRVRRKMYRLAREHGLFGGAVVFHPYRLKCQSCGSAIPDYQGTCPDCGKDSFSWFWSPHFHAVGFGWIHHTAEGYQRHGWVVKNLGIRQSVFWTFQYLLSHAGISVVHTTTWFGQLSYNSMGRTPTPGSFLELCPLCGRALKPMVWLPTDRPPPERILEREPYANQFLAEPGSWRCI